jgi:MFS family permease
MQAINSTPGARRLLAISVIARLPLTMISIGLLIHTQHLTGSFGSAGLVDGTYAVSLAVGGPALGQLVDRRGQTQVLLTSSVVAAAALGAIALLPAAVPLPVLVALAGAVGLATPPVGAGLRALFPDLFGDAEAVRAAYAVDATVVELTWIAGPPIALAVGAIVSTGAALAAAGAILLAGTLAFAMEPSSRSWRPLTAAERKRGSAMSSSGMRTLVIALTAVGALFAAVQVGVAASAQTLGSTASAGPLLAVWGAGSLLGGLVASRLGGGARSATGLALVLAALAVGHLALVGAAGSLVTIAAVLLVGGAAIAPTYATVYAMVDDVAPAGTATEAFAWLATAAAIGASAGSGLAGALTDTAGPTAAFALAGGLGALAVLTVVLRPHTLEAPQPVASAADSELSPVAA